MEATVPQVALIDLDWTSLIAHHEFLEREEADIPRISFFIGHKLRDWGWVLQHWSDLPLPDAAIDVAEA